MSGPMVPVTLREGWDEVQECIDRFPDATVHRLPVERKPWMTREIELYGIPDEVLVIITDKVPGGCIVWARRRQHWSINSDERWAVRLLAERVVP